MPVLLLAMPGAMAAVGRDTIAADRERHVQRRRRRRRLRKVCDADASNTQCCKSRARGPRYPCTYMFAGAPWRFVTKLLSRSKVLKHHIVVHICITSFTRICLIHWLQVVWSKSYTPYPRARTALCSLAL